MSIALMVNGLGCAWLKLWVGREDQMAYQQ